jgi:hypothetical protein
LRDAALRQMQAFPNYLHGFNVFQRDCDFLRGSGGDGTRLAE